MMHRIVEAFTKGHCQISAMDELVITATIAVPLILVFLIAAFLLRK